VSEAEATDVVLTIPEMDCAGCAQRIRDRLCTLEGVDEAAGQPVSRAAAPYSPPTASSA